MTSCRRQTGRKGKQFNGLIVADEASSIPLAEHGGHVVQPEERAKWEEGARGVWTDFAGTVGGADKIEAIRKIA
ncbi:MAG: hypothetical protein EOR73_14050 [Mesorhizobium sp.]|nr:MAG: hypothetical protein EOR73_14050 [Mesorhizobium sp.]